jgi:hypothetical protein
MNCATCPVTRKCPKHGIPRICNELANPNHPDFDPRWPAHLVRLAANPPITAPQVSPCRGCPGVGVFYSDP